MNHAARFVPTERDTQIVVTAYLYGGVCAEHIRRRFFPTPGARSACYTRIAKLVAAGYLVSCRLPPSGAAGSGKAFLTPGPAARPLLAQVLGLSRTELVRLRMKEPAVIQHHLALCDVRLAIELACDRSALFTLTDWQRDGEVALRVTDPKTDAEAAILPDATFTLALADHTEQTFYLELDRGSMTAPKRMRARLRAYLAHARKQPTPVLWVVPDGHRRDTIAAWAKGEADQLGADPTVFWIAVKDTLNETTVLAAPIWQVVGLAQPIALHHVALSSPQGEPSPPPIASPPRPAALGALR